MTDVGIHMLYIGDSLEARDHIDPTTIKTIVLVQRNDYFNVSMVQQRVIGRSVKNV